MLDGPGFHAADGLLHGGDLVGGQLTLQGDGEHGQVEGLRHRCVEVAYHLFGIGTLLQDAVEAVEPVRG